MARPMIKEARMASLLLENPYYILLRYIEVSRLIYRFSHKNGNFSQSIEFSHQFRKYLRVK